MYSRLVTLVCVKFLVVSSAACGAETQKAPPVSLEELCPRIAAAQCEGYANCCTVFDVGTRPACITQRMTECENQVRTARTEFSSSGEALPLLPGVVFDPNTAGEAVQEIERAAASCGYAPVSVLIASAFGPGVDQGGACSAGKECRDSLLCRPTVEGGALTCLPPAQEGETCAEFPNRNCGFNLQCELASRSSPVGTCRPVRDRCTDAEPCAENGEACLIPGDCRSLSCDRGICGPCVSRTDCLGGLFCVDGMCDLGSDRVSRFALPDPDRGPGEHCDHAGQCVSGLCNDGVCGTPSVAENYCITP